MNQQEVRQFVERYFAAFGTHVQESHPHYLTVKLPVEVDKDIGNRPFYWSWVEKMNIPPQPMVLTFFFDPEKAPKELRGEPIHFGSGRLQQIFQSAANHGRFVCMYEQPPVLTGNSLPSARRSQPLTPWLGLNVKVSFICDKKKDLLLYLGVNLYQPRIVHDFYPFLCRLSLTPSIPAYFYTQERRIQMPRAMELIEREVRRLIAQQDSRWAEEARERLQEELDMLEAYYEEMRQRAEKEGSSDNDADAADKEPPLEPDQEKEQERMTPSEVLASLPEASFSPSATAIAPPVSLVEYRSGGGRILDFLRMHSIPETPKEEINQREWRSSTPEEEKERRMAELRWQYEPRIEVTLINGGLFYLHNMPPFSP